MHQKNILNNLIACFGMPVIFLSKLNKWLHRYVTWVPDPGASYIDAMSISWENQLV